MKNPPIEEAKKLVTDIISRCNLVDLILLDQWRRDIELNEWRVKDSNLFTDTFIKS